MKVIFSRLIALAALATCTGFALAEYDVRMVGVVFDPGADQIETADQITGKESVMYRFRPNEGQYLRVRLKPNNEYTEFVVYGPGKWPGEVLHDSETSGSFEYEGKVKRTGPHAVSVFQLESAVAEGMTSEYELVIQVTDTAE